MIISESLKHQLEMARKETEAANEASREILRRYALEMTSAKNDLINAQQQITQLEEALETHENTSNERLTQAQGDIILLQVESVIITSYLFISDLFLVLLVSSRSYSLFICPLFRLSLQYEASHFQMGLIEFKHRVNSLLNLQQPFIS